MQYIVDADDGLRRIAPLKELRIGDLADTVKCRRLASVDESLVAHLKQFVASIGEVLLDNRSELLDRLDAAIRYLHQHEGT